MVIMAVTPAHKPSRPSIRLREFVAPRTKIITIGAPKTGSSDDGSSIPNCAKIIPRFGLIPTAIRIIAASICPIIFWNGRILRRSSISPTKHATDAPANMPISSLRYDLNISVCSR